MSDATPSGPGWDALARAAARRDAGEDPADWRQLLAFELDGDAYALPVELVREIGRLRPLTPVPRVPADVPGVISLRGEIVQVVDLRARLGLPRAEPTRASRIVIVFAGEGGIAGLLVDSVSEVMRVAEDSLRPASPGEVGSVEALCTRGNGFVSLLDLDRILDFHGDR